MASDGNPVQIPAISLVHGSQAPTTGDGSAVERQFLAAARQCRAPGAAANRPHDPRAADAPGRLQAQVALLNKYLNDSGRPDQFRVDPNSDSKLIQEVNPATGEVIGEYPAISFPALARSVGISSAVIDEHA